MDTSGITSTADASSVRPPAVRNTAQHTSTAAATPIASQIHVLLAFARGSKSRVRAACSCTSAAETTLIPLEAKGEPKGSPFVVCGREMASSGVRLKVAYLLRG